MKVKKKLVAFLMVVCMAAPSVGTVGTTVEAADKEWFRSKKITFYPSGRSGACRGNYN